MTQDFILRPACEVKEGDRLDLEADPYADPKHSNALLEHEWAEVTFVERETLECVAIGIEGFDLVGFPPNHLLKVRKEAA